MSGGREVADDLTPRLSTAAGRVADARKQLELALATRDAIIAEADEHGMTQRAIARHAGVSQPHVIRVLAAHAVNRALP